MVVILCWYIYGMYVCFVAMSVCVDHYGGYTMLFTIAVMSRSAHQMYESMCLS